MSTPSNPSCREVLVEGLGRLSEDEKQKLCGPRGAVLAERRGAALEEDRRWVLALVLTMALFAIVVPTSAFYHIYEATESFSILGFLGTVAGACTFAAAQMGWAVALYMKWRHRLRCFRALQALGRTTGANPEITSS